MEKRMNRHNILIDSGILIAYLQGDERIALQFRSLLAGNSIFVTPVSVSEILSRLRSREEQKIEKIFEIIKVIDIDKKTGKIAGSILNRYDCYIGNALIAAAAESLQLQLWTNTPERYPSLPRESFWIFERRT